VRISHVYYKHENIDKAKQFMEDFGFVETAEIGKKTFYRGYGTEPFVMALEASTTTEFGGAAFAVESEEDLEYASKILPKESKPTEVYDLKDTPGGGRAVTFYDPVDGFPFHLVYGQTPAEPRDPGFPTLKVNYVSNTNTPIFFPSYTESSPSPVRRFSHNPAQREKPRSQRIPTLQEAASTSP